jgi:hypothetical protein
MATNNDAAIMAAKNFLLLLLSFSLLHSCVVFGVREKLFTFFA